MAIVKGNKVKIDYKGTFNDGTVFDSSEKNGPIEFEVGKKQVIKGFESAVIGMEKNSEKDISLEPAEAYGDINPQLVKEVPKDKMPPGQEIKKGMFLAMGLPDGNQIPAKVTEIKKDVIMVDLNHPMAGKTLNFNIKVVDYSEVEETKEEVKKKNEEEVKEEDKSKN